MKVKPINSKTDNDCVVSAISTMTKKPYNSVAKTLTTKKGLVNDWVGKAAWNYNLEFRQLKKPGNLTLKQLGEHSKKYKSGVIYGIQSTNKQNKGSHAMFIKNGVVYDNAKVLDDNLKVRVRGYFVNVKDKK